MARDKDETKGSWSEPVAKHFMAIIETNVSEWIPSRNMSAERGCTNSEGLEEM